MISSGITTLCILGIPIIQKRGIPINQIWLSFWGGSLSKLNRKINQPKCPNKKGTQFSMHCLRTAFSLSKWSFTGWWFGICFVLPYIGNFIIPTDEHIFSEGLKPPTRWVYPIFRSTHWSSISGAGHSVRSFSHENLRVFTEDFPASHVWLPR